MNRIWIIAKRELASYFDSLMAYIIMILFLGLTGIFTWLAPNNVFFQGQAVLGIFFNVVYLSLLFFIPAITMRTIAEETGSGTLELLSTKAITDWHIVIGKYLSSLLLIVIALACTLPYYITVSKLGNADHGAILGGYFGLILYTSAFTSLGVFASSLTNNQIVAFLVAVAFLLTFTFVLGFLAGSIPGTVGNLLYFLSARTHYDSLSRGLIDSRDLLYFLGITFLGLLFSQAMLAKRNWKN